MHATNFLFASSYNILVLFVFVLFAVRAAQLFSLIKRGETNESNFSARLNELLFLSSAMILLGGFGYFSEQATASCRGNLLPGGSFVTIICTVADSAQQAGTIATCFIKSTSAMATGLLAAAVSGSTWFLLQQKLAK
jgi:hypothetical protein